MQETKFNYVVSNDNTLVSPDTGTYTSMSASSNINNTTNTMNGGNNYLLYGTIIFSLILIIFSIVSIIRKKNRFKSSTNEAIKHKTNVALVILATILLSSSFIALIANITNYTTATTIPNDDFTTKKDVTTTVTLDKTGSVTACATDTVTMTKALAHGYILSFTASNIDPAISSITEYELTIDDETTPTTITPNNTITIKDITTAISAGDTTDVTLCISFPADTEPGIYTVTGTYDSITNTDCTANEICYNDNGANSPTTMSHQTVRSNVTSVSLWASNFQYTGGGYGFAGWNTKADGTGISYGPNETITDETVLNKIKSEGLDLYAIWIPSAGNLQNWNGCNTMNIGDVTALTDTRDNNTYAVAKLADNKCWMIENLRLDSTAELTTTNTNNPLNNAGIVTIKNSDGNTTNHLSASTNPTTTAWCMDYNSACYDKSMVFTGNTTNTVSNMTSAYASIYSYGNYYNWYSATAGYGTYSKLSGNTAGDICPAGWHLPTGGDIATELGALDVVMGGTGSYQETSVASQRWRKFPNNFVYSGNVYDSSVYGRGVEGRYWSSTAYNRNNAYHLTFHSIFVYPDSRDYYKYEGFMARCVF